MSKIILTTQEELYGIIHNSIREALQYFRPIPNEEDKEEILLTRKEAAKKLKISLVTLNSWTKAGLIKSYIIGGRVLYKSKELEKSLCEVKTVKF